MTADTPSYSAFETIFREQYSSLANYAYSVLRNKEDAEDVVQEVFIRIWQNNPAVLKDPKVKFYLLTAIKNGCISHLRKQATKKTVSYEEIHPATVADTTATNDKKEVTAAVINEALSLLPPQCLVVFKLSRFGKLTYQEIAEELNISVKTVENQVGKALKIMREFARQHNLSFSLLLLVMMQGLYPAHPIA